MRKHIKKIIETKKKLHFANKVKKQAFYYEGAIKVNKKTRVNTNTVLGYNVNFNGLTIHGQGRVEIGNNFHSGPDVLILTRNHSYDYGDKLPFGSTNIEETTKILDNVWLGARVTLLPGITIEEGAIIQAGAVVVSNIPKCAIYGGNPAQLIKYRDMAHYNDLKRKRHFR